MLPAPAQGALAVSAARPTASWVGAARRARPRRVRAAVLAERALLAGLEAGTPPRSAPSPCSPRATHGPELFLRGSVTAADGCDAVRLSATGPVNDAEAMGRRLAAELLADGAKNLVGSTR